MASKVLPVMWAIAALLLSNAAAFSLLKHDTSPLFTKSFQVHSLSSQSYDVMLQDSDTVWLVDYYAPWCPHCRHFAPEWERIASFYAKTDKVQVGAVDCTKNTEICNGENIFGYPGVKIHHVPADAEKAVMMPRGTMSSKAVIGWAERLMKEHGIKSGVNVEELAVQLKNFRNDAVVADGDEGEMYNDQSLEMKYKRLHDAGIATVSTFQNGFFVGANVLEGERYEVALMWVEALVASFPMKKNRIMHNTVNKVLKKEQWPSKTACPICYVENGEPISLDPVRLHEDEIVAYVTSAYGHDDEEIYDLDAAHNAYKTRKHRGFNHTASSSNGSPLFTTEQCQVRTLNSDGHAAMLADPSAVWLVDYYAPWCPHCRQFAPAWEKAAAFYADNAKINIAAVDCTQNSDVCNKEGILGYPTIKLYHVPSESIEPIKMPPKSRRNTNTVIAWVEEQMEEHDMKTSADTEDIDAHIEKINNGCEMGTVTKAAVDSKVTEKVLSDQSVEMKYKRLHDAGIAAVSTFENGFYVGTTVLEGERYDAAVTWVEALAKSFPMEGNRIALETLAGAIKKQNKWEQAEWNTLLTQWKKNATETSFPVNLFESKKDWAYCTTYTCGVWTLFHTLSVSEVKSETALKPSEIMAAIRLFVKYFFNCEECQRHFMMANPESLLEKLAESDAEGPRAVAIWIWKMHNKVNKVLKYNQWPTLKNCPKCYVNDGEPLDLNPARLHEEEILDYVKSVFGHKDTDLFFLDAASNGVWTATMCLINEEHINTNAAVAVLLMLPFILRSKKAPKTDKTD
ncbi:Protein disulfide-isomerase domain [Phytophthora palmivora]|uniref:Sulfhydryl oxidase n=1 Tax=Phytophthora palmivora TaxID=4796 RepID=A0A2P4YCL7_9STRA|nr:Protein disulfide-isomerase domain [Phytophthora palmivora]